MQGFACRTPYYDIVQGSCPGTKVQVSGSFHDLLPTPIKYFQGFHSGNGEHEVVEGPSPIREEASARSPSLSLLPTRKSKWCSMLTFSMSHTYLGSRAAGPLLSSALPHPNASPCPPLNLLFQLPSCEHMHLDPLKIETVGATDGRPKELT